VVWGKQDKILPVKHTDAVVKAIPNAKLELLDECGYCPQMEHPKVFNSFALQFLDNH
jgi:pimeloyl-ACP methyl ester carboxylesterase